MPIDYGVNSIFKHVAGVIIYAALDEKKKQGLDYYDGMVPVTPITLKT
jgi:hypothetical protein